MATLTGTTALHNVFPFLDGPAEVLSASAVCRCWYKLATNNVLWKIKFEREGMAEKARAFEIVKPPTTGGLSFYSQVFTLKVQHR